MDAKLLTQVAGIPEATLTDWGPVEAPIGEPVSQTCGAILHQDADGANEADMWICTPGTWRCEIERAEFCQFLAGRAVYVSDDGARIEVAGGDAAYFPTGWRGTCEVIASVRKTYMIP
jgi:uncharacterized cupin superfamily protein